MGDWYDFVIVDGEFEWNFGIYFIIEDIIISVYDLFVFSIKY